MNIFPHCTEVSLHCLCCCSRDVWQFTIRHWLCMGQTKTRNSIYNQKRAFSPLILYPMGLAHFGIIIFLKLLARYNWPKAVRPGVLNAKYHVITNAAYSYSCLNRDPVLAKFKHVTNIETCTLLSYHVVESSGCKHGGKRCSLLWQKRQNFSKISMDRLIKVDEKMWVI